jgi:hypothetical protein
MKLAVATIITAVAALPLALVSAATYGPAKVHTDCGSGVPWDILPLTIRQYTATALTNTYNAVYGATDLGDRYLDNMVWNNTSVDPNMEKGSMLSRTKKKGPCVFNFVVCCLLHLSSIDSALNPSSHSPSLAPFFTATTLVVPDVACVTRTLR